MVQFVHPAISAAARKMTRKVSPVKTPIFDNSLKLIKISLILGVANSRKMKEVFVLACTFLLTTGAFAAKAGELKKGGDLTGGEEEQEQEKAKKSAQGQVLILDFSMFNPAVEGDSTATIGPFGSSARFRKVTPDMIREMKGL